MGRNRQDRSTTVSSRHLCRDDEFYDSVVERCALCSDICRPIIDQTACITKCPNYYRRHPSLSQVVEPSTAKYRTVQSSVSTSGVQSSVEELLIMKPLFWTSIFSMVIALSATIVIIVLCFTRGRRRSARGQHCFRTTTLNIESQEILRHSESDKNDFSPDGIPEPFSLKSDGSLSSNLPGKNSSKPLAFISHHQHVGNGTTSCVNNRSQNLSNGLFASTPAPPPPLDISAARPRLPTDTNRIQTISYSTQESCEELGKTKPSSDLSFSLRSADDDQLTLKTPEVETGVKSSVDDVTDEPSTHEIPSYSSDISITELSSLPGARLRCVDQPMNSVTDLRSVQDLRLDMSRTEEGYCTAYGQQ